MPQSTDLVGLGMAPELARELGNQASALTCAASSTQTGAAKVLTTNVELTAAGGANSAILPATAKIGTPYFFFTTSSTAAIIYSPVGDVMNGTSNAGVTLAQNKAALIIKYKQAGSVGSWSSITTA